MASATTPRSFRTQQADAFSFHFTSCEMVGLRSEKSLFFFCSRRNRPANKVIDPTDAPLQA